VKLLGAINFHLVRHENLVGIFVVWGVFEVNVPFFSLISDDERLNAGRNRTHVTSGAFLLPRRSIPTFANDMNIRAFGSKVWGKYMCFFLPGMVEKQPLPLWIKRYFNG
jgi:hypothetical protein